jgi:hypothetical protein
MGPESEFTIGEIARACARIEKKVDDQAETITSVNLRLTAIEASTPERTRGAAKPLAVGAGLGSAIVGAVQYLWTHWKPGP